MHEIPLLADIRQCRLCELPQLQLTLAIGQYAQAYHLPGPARPVTQAVQDWRVNWPHLVAAVLAAASVTPLQVPA